MVIYLKGEHGTRIAYTEAEAVSHEKDGYVRYDPKEEMAKKRADMAKPVKRRKRNAD